jgi:hypothetical protein
VILESVIYRDSGQSRPDIGCDLGSFPYLDDCSLWDHVIGNRKRARVGTIIHLLCNFERVIIDLISDVDSVEFD